MTLPLRLSRTRGLVLIVALVSVSLAQAVDVSFFLRQSTCLTKSPSELLAAYGHLGLLSARRDIPRTIMLGFPTSLAFVILMLKNAAEILT